MRIERLLLSLAVACAALFSFSRPAFAQLGTAYLALSKVDVATADAKDTIGNDAILVGIATAGEIDIDGLGTFPGFNLNDGTSTAWGYQFLTPSGDDGIALGIIQLIGVDFIQRQRGNDFGLEARELDLSGAYSNSDAFVAQLKTNSTFTEYMQDYPDAVPEGIALTWEPDGESFLPEEFPLDMPIWGIYFNSNAPTPDDSTMVCFVASGTGETHCIRADVSGVKEEKVSGSVRLTVAPNPARESGIATLHIGSGKGEGSVREVGLYDIVGGKVLDLTNTLVADGVNGMKAAFGLNDLPSGTYVCRVVQGSHISSVQFVVE